MEKGRICIAGAALSKLATGSTGNSSNTGKMIADFIKGKRILLAALISGIAIAAIYAGLPVSDTRYPTVYAYRVTGSLVDRPSAPDVEELHVHIRKQTWNGHRWQEAWDGIRDILTFYHPLPPSTTFTIAPDAALYLLRHIMETTPPDRRTGRRIIHYPDGQTDKSKGL